MSETKTLASYIVNGRYDDIPADVRHEAARSLVNFMAVALGGSVDPAVDIAIRALTPFSGKPTAAILGRVERLDPLHASLMNGISSHVDDFDDTTPQNYIHPTSPVASAMFAYASANRVSGRDFINCVRAGLRGRVAGWQRRVSVALRRRLAHHRHRRHLRCGGGHRSAARSVGAADGLGAGPCRDTGRGPARDVRVDGQGVSSRPRGAERLCVGDSGGRRLHGR